MSFEAFIDACADVNGGRASVADFHGKLPTLSSTVASTAILEAGRRSLDNGGRPFELQYQSEIDVVPRGMAPQVFSD